MRSCHVISTLEPGGGVRQLRLSIAAAAARPAAVLALGGGAAARWLEADRTPFSVLGRGPADPAGWWRLHRHIRRLQPDCIHVHALRGSMLPLLAAVRPGASIWTLSRNDWTALCRRGRWRRFLAPRSDHLQVRPPLIDGRTAATAFPLRELAIPADARIILCAGRLVPRNRFKNAIWTLDILKYLYGDVYLLLAGDGPDRQRLEQFAQDIRVADRVRFLGWQSEMGPLYRAADLVWHPGTNGVLPYPILEAMAAGKPVIAARSESSEPYLTAGDHGYLVPPDDKPALARMTQKLLENEPLRRQAGAAGRRAIWQQSRAASSGCPEIRELAPDPGRRTAG